MTIALDIISRAFSRAGVKTAETPLNSDEVQDGLNLLNDMGSAWEQDLKLGFEPVEKISDTVRIPRFAEFAFKENLALLVASEYSAQIDQLLLASAATGLSRLEAAVVHIGDVQYPSTLPIGTGNGCKQFIDREFFPENEKENF